MNACKLKEEILEMDALKIITEGQMKQDAPVIRVGDTVKVHVKIREGRARENPGV